MTEPMSPERLEDLVTTTEGCHMRALAGVAELLAEAKRAREQEAFLRKALDEIAGEFILWKEENPQSNADYVGARYAETAGNWMRKPTFAAFLRSASPASVEGVSGQ